MYKLVAKFALEEAQDVGGVGCECNASNVIGIRRRGGSSHGGDERVCSLLGVRYSIDLHTTRIAHERSRPTSTK